MPDKIIVNVQPYQGEYEFALDGRWSYVEWRWIKQISGYMPLTWEEGIRGGDPDLFLAFAVMALHRAGRIEKREALAVAEEIENAEVDGATISFQPEAEDAEEVDPPSSSVTEDLPPSSGDGTSEPTELPQESKTPSDSGLPISATGSDLARLTSVT